MRKKPSILLMALCSITLLGSIFMTSCNGCNVEQPPIGGIDNPIGNIPNGDLIAYAASLKDGVNARYADPIRSSALVENQSMTLLHGLNGKGGSTAVPNLITAISNKQGGNYLVNTMDAFVKTKAGKTYYASDWMTGSSFNVLRGGIYYQDVRISDQGFGDGDAIMKDGQTIDLNGFGATGNDVTSEGVKKGIYSFSVNALHDPGVVTKNVSFDTKKYNALLLTVKTEDSIVGELFLKTSGMGNFSAGMSKHFSLIPGDDYHSYIIRLDDLDGYQGKVDGIRFDIGSAVGETVSIKSLMAININENTVPVRFERKLHTYSNKLHQELHFVTTAQTSEVASYGMVTELKEETVAALLIQDQNGRHTAMEAGIDWESVEYVAFDIQNVGIFGYILPVHEGSGSLRVELTDGVYRITQEMQASGKLKAKTHLYMGHRIYTDASHDFTAFLEVAQTERNPLGKEAFTVRYVKDEPAMFSTYMGYEPLRGAYGIKMNYTDFNRAFKQHWNQHFRAYTTVKGDELDREIYLYTYTGGDQLESAVLLDDKDMLLPVQMQVIKNFTNDGEESIFVRDAGYSEVYMPLQVNAGSTRAFSILNLYQNWGNVPLKQLSWIQYSSPYYHLSTGVTETNCIEPMYGGNAFQFVNNVDKGIVYEFHVTSGKSLHTLPDFRPMSQAFWDSQPQHYSAAEITWLEYTDRDGRYSASEFQTDRVASSGPVYADLTMDYLSDDGRITGQMRHVEMPQTDENRTYYSLKYEIKDRIDFENFTEDFTIIEMNSRWGGVQFKKFGYLDENNQCRITSTNLTNKGRYTKLGKDAPYFDVFDNAMPNAPTNYGLIIQRIDAKIGGKQYDGNLMLEDWAENGRNYARLSLDLGEVTLQSGDYINIDMILLPWGDTESKNDDSIRQVRQDSCLKPFTATPIVGEAMADAFIPSIRAKDNVAEFEFSGGHNNGVVRVYGFDILTRPIISEYIDGKWVTLDLSSRHHPDLGGYAHYYDGFAAYYDGDGTFSYAFVIDTEQGSARKFRVTAEEFVPYQTVETGTGDGLPEDVDEETVPIEDETPPSGKGAPILYYSAQDIYLTAKDHIGQSNLSNALLKREEADGTKYVRLSAQAGAQGRYSTSPRRQTP